MAQTIYGLDIGAFSVKVSFVQVSFRSFAWAGYKEFPIPHAGRGRPERVAAEVLRELSQRMKGDSAFVVCALPGDRVMTRFVALPFSDQKRIDSVLGFELEGMIPLGVEDMHYTYQVVGESDDGETMVFAAAASHDTIQRYLETLSDVELDPRIITLDTTSYVNLYDHLVGEGTAAFVDIGHRTTKVCVVEDGQLRMARSIGRGGMAVTQALADQREISFEEAETFKHEHGALPMPGDEIVSKDANTAAEAMGAVVMGIRQSCQAYTKRWGRTVDRVLVTGGGARLDNALLWLESQLQVPVEQLQLRDLEFNRLGPDEDVGGAAKSLGLALTQAAASRHLSTLNFRRGPYAYEGDYMFLRDKLKSLAAMAAVLIMVAAMYAVVKNNSLDKVLTDQGSMLGDFTEENLGSRQTSFSKTLKMLSRPASELAGADLFPPMTAIAALERITAIQEDLNRDAMRAGGPPSAAVPGRPVGPRASGRALQDAIPSTSDLTVPTVSPAAIERAAASRGTVAQANPRFRSPGERPGIEPDDAPIEGAAEGAPGEAEAADDAMINQRKIELSEVDIDVYNDVRILAETHQSNIQGKEVFRSRLDAEPCFSQVKRRDIGEVVSTGRHSDWVRFEITFKVKCKKDDEEEER